MPRVRESPEVIEDRIKELFMGTEEIDYLISLPDIFIRIGGRI